MLTPLALAVFCLAQQQESRPPATDTIYATPQLAALIAQAAVANRNVPEQLRSYRARVETEFSIAIAMVDGQEVSPHIEQIASDIYWRSDGGLLQKVVGYRGQTMPWYTVLDYFEVPTIVPALYGERLDLIKTREPRKPREGDAKRVPVRAVHPFAAAREEFYRYSGGDTVETIHLARRDVALIRIRVVPRGRPATRMLLFDGFLDIDAARLQVVRMEGRLARYGSGMPPADVVQANLYVRFESAEYDEKYWLPREQRLEMQMTSPMFSETRGVLRVISRFVEIDINDSTAARLAPPPDSFPLGRLERRGDSGVSKFDDWSVALGALQVGAGARDFDTYGPLGDVRTREPRLSFGSRHMSHLIRYNGVERMYTGAGVKYDFGRTAPGLMLRAHAGWAWHERTVRGGIELGRLRGDWELIARADRHLERTEDLGNVVRSDPGIPPVIGGDQFFDRRVASVIARTVRARGTAWRLETGAAADRVAGRNVVQLQGPVPSLEKEIPLTRAIREGDFWLTRIEGRRNPSASAMSVRPELMLRASYERADGTIAWQRVEVGGAIRRRLQRWTFTLRGDVGRVFSHRLPPQALFQIPTVGEVSVADDQSFTGDQALIGRASIMYTLPVLNAPLRWGKTWLPAPAPSPAIGIRAGRTDASPRARALMNEFGWRTSNGARASIDAGVRFFGGAFSIGAGRALENGAKWRFILGGAIAG